MERNPHVATLLGVHDYDTLPTDTHLRQASSFSEVIQEKVEAGGRIEDVVGAGVLDEETYREVKEDIRELSQGTGERLE